MQQIQHRELLRVAQTIFFVLLWSLTIAASARAQNPKHIDTVVITSPAHPNQSGDCPPNDDTGLTNAACKLEDYSTSPGSSLKGHPWDPAPVEPGVRPR